MRYGDDSGLTYLVCVDSLKMWIEDNNLQVSIKQTDGDVKGSDRVKAVLLCALLKFFADSILEEAINTEGNADF